MKRIILAGVLGAIAMFIWSSIAHILLPLGEVGVQGIPNETAVLSSMSSSLSTASGLYLFPATGAAPNATRAERQAAMRDYGKKLAVNPSGILVYHPPGQSALTARQLGTEFLTELIESLLAAFLLAQTRLATFASRLGFIAVLGLAAAITTNIPYWNWYGFPANYTAAYMTIEFFDYFVAGLVLAALVKAGSSRMMATAA